MMQILVIFIILFHPKNHVMKNIKFLFIGLLLLSYNSGMTQPEKDRLLIGGNVGFSFTKVENSDNIFTFNFNPGIALFVNDNVAAGGSVRYTFQRTDDFSRSDLSFLPMARYYIDSDNENVAFYVEGGAGVSVTSIKVNGNSNSDAAFSFIVGPGIAYFLSKDVSIDTGLTYSRTGGDPTFSRVLFNIGLQVWMPSKQDN
jgi:opacity protein-like surface antigen